ncbi:MAG: hypothetical protein J6V02_04930 [Bacteroidaceae bacterium]|nr:hypothetical protein [Bacteroidaceae bacterium]
MRNSRKLMSISLLLVVGLLMAACGSSGAVKEKKPKGLILPEGDNATLVVDGSYTTITFPAELSAEDQERYSTDFVGYIMSLNGKISTSGNEMNNYPIYYYMHNDGQWLFKGEYDNPAVMTVSRIKSIKISNTPLRLRDFNKLMPLLDNSKEKKNDQGYQDEILFGSNRYTFVEIHLRN